jgi:hypothetical protein
MITGDHDLHHERTRAVMAALMRKHTGARDTF